MNLAEALLHALRDHGVKELFGLPGDFALPFFKVVEESGILPCYTFSHEPAVGFAADAAARYRGAPSVAAVTYGAGGLNMVNPIAAAYAEKSPVVVISGAPGTADRNTGLLIHHQAKQLGSQLAVYREVTCAQAILDNTHDAPQEIARVLACCRRESRPVYLELPRDLVFSPCDRVEPEAPAAVDRDAVDACIDEIEARLQQAKHPVLLVGIEVRRYGLEGAVATLATRLGLPVVTTFMGRGMFADSAVPLRGTYMGVAGDPAVTDLVEHSDALVCLGVITSDSNFGTGVRRIDFQQATLVCDGQVAMGYHVYPNLPIDALVNQWQERLPPSTAASRAEQESAPTGLSADSQPVRPIDIATALNDLFATHGPLPVAADMGDCFFTAMSLANTELVAPGYYATMGYGVPGGLGLQASTGSRAVIMVGDGAFQMTGWELLNCRRYGWDPIVVLFNNASWEMLRVFQPESAFNDLETLDFSALAGSLGGDGYRVKTRAELKAALDRAHATRGRFQLVEVLIERGEISPTLQRFVDGINRMRAGS